MRGAGGIQPQILSRQSRPRYKKKPVWRSTNKNWDEKIKLLPELERVPNAAEMSWFITTYFEVHGIKLFKDIYLCTSSLNSNGRHVCVGYFSFGRLRVKDYLDGDRVGIGLSAARK